jgi:hypothetical protein
VIWIEATGAAWQATGGAAPRGLTLACLMLVSKPRRPGVPRSYVMAIDAFKPQFHITINLEGDDCDAGGSALWIKYTSDALISLVKYPPKSKKMIVTINAPASAKGVKAEVGKDGSSLVVTGSGSIEAVGWSDTISNALKRVSTNN